MDKKSWRERIDNYREPVDFQEELEKEKRPSTNDVQMVHPDNKSNVKINDDGTVQAFGDQNLGIKIDPDSKAIILLADRVKVKSSEFSVNTDDRGFKWNYCPLNPDMASPFREVVTTRRFGTKLLKTVLNSPGMYANAGGPVAPAGASALMQYIDLQGKRPYTNQLPPELQKVLGIAKGTGEMIGDVSSELVNDLL